MRVRPLVLVLAAATLGGLTAAPANTASAACPGPPKALTSGRPAMLGSVFPTPRLYVYTGARRGKNGAAIVTGYMKPNDDPTVHGSNMMNAYISWFGTISGGGHYQVSKKFGSSHIVISFKAIAFHEHGQVDLYKTCSPRVTAVITLYET